MDASDKILGLVQSGVSDNGESEKPTRRALGLRELPFVWA
jgi:hypothetical protein